MINHENKRLGMENKTVEIKNNLKLIYTAQDPIMIIEIQGEIDTYNASEFLREVVRQISMGYNRLLLDGTELSYISSTGIGVVADIHKRIAHAGGQIVIASLQPKVSDVFKLLGFAKVFKYTASKEEALELLKRGMDKK
jgi:stage II sporulation protein AA (anti-sigma F factor antagonist)